MTHPKNIAFIGQGPNRKRWEEALAYQEDHGGQNGLAEAVCSRLALTGSCGSFLANLIGVSLQQFLRFTRLNLNARYYGKNGKGDLFSMEEAQETIERWGDALPRRCVLLGGFVTKAVLATRPTPLKTFYREGRSYLTFPHPSRLNRWWNRQANREAARESLLQFMD